MDECFFTSQHRDLIFYEVGALSTGQMSAISIKTCESAVSSISIKYHFFKASCAIRAR